MLDTKERILQVAEKLFIEKGIEGSSLRAITTEANANIAAINYHFGSKDKLVQEVFKKYLYPLDHVREKILKEAFERSPDGLLKVKDLVRAFLLPWFEFKAAHPQVMQIFMRFYGLQAGVTNSSFRKMVTETAKDAYAVFSEGVFKALCDIPEDILKKRINIAVATGASFVINGWLIRSLETISGVETEQDYLIDHLVAIIEKGIVG